MDVSAPSRRIYPIGSDRDVRVRAVLGTHRLELGVNAIEEGLRSIRFVGRTLRLRYHRRDQRFFWRRRVRNGEGRTVAWEDIGVRVPEGVRQTLWAETRSRIDGAEEWMAMRQDGRSVLALVDWLAVHGIQSAVASLEMTWRGEGNVGRIHWTFRADGGIQRTQNWQTPERSVTAYGRTTAAVLSAVDVTRGRGPYTVSLDQTVVQRHAAIDKRLEELAGLLREQRAGIRLYWRSEKDAWRFHEVVSVRRTQHVRLEKVGGRAQRLAAQPRSQVLEALKLLGERGQIRRVLRLVAELTERVSAVTLY